MCNTFLANVFQIYMRYYENVKVESAQFVILLKSFKFLLNGYVSKSLFFILF